MIKLQDTQNLQKLIQIFQHKYKVELSQQELKIIQDQLLQIVKVSCKNDFFDASFLQKQDETLKQLLIIYGKLKEDILDKHCVKLTKTTMYQGKNVVSQLITAEQLEKENNDKAEKAYQQLEIQKQALEKSNISMNVCIAQMQENARKLPKQDLDQLKELQDQLKSLRAELGQKDYQLETMRKNHQQKVLQIQQKK